jgi:hypothetical protein
MYLIYRSTINAVRTLPTYAFFIFLLCVVYILLAVSPTQARTLYVSPEGDADHPGTRELPFATVFQARDAVRAYIARGLKEDVEIVLLKGSHRLREPLILDARDSGTSEHRVTWRADRSDLVILSGGVKIGEWEVGAEGVWKAKIPEALLKRAPFRQLYHLCYALPRARYPNTGYLRAEKVGQDRRSNFTMAEADQPDLTDLEGVELVFLHDWSITRSSIQSIDPVTRRLTLPYPIAPNCRWAAMDWFEKQPRYFLENSRIFLDTPREWYADWQAAVLYYKPVDRQRPNRFPVVAPLLDQLLVVRGEPGRLVENLHFVGLHFRHTGWRPERGVYFGRQATTYFPVDEEGHREAYPATLQFDFAENCSVQGGSVRQCGGSGIWLRRSCRENVVDDVTVARLGGNGIMIGEGQVRKLDDGRPWWEGAPEQCASGNIVRHCGVYDCGREMFGAVGVWVGLAAKTQITHNALQGLPYTGISLGWMWWNPQARPAPRATPCRENTVAYNRISQVMRTLSDGGGIYTLGDQPGSRLVGNVIHDIPRNVGRAESNGMFLDQGTGSFTVEDNLIYGVDRSPFRFHKGWKNVLRNNTVRLPEGVPLLRYNDTKKENIILENNRELKTDADLKACIQTSREKLKQRNH